MANISVIVPVYKVEAYLSACIESILRQTYTDFEIVLVDDGSPDQCPQLCDDYAERDTRIHVIHQQNKGLSAARNAGLDWIFEHSISEWITFIDSDDWIHPDYLYCLVNANKINNTLISRVDYKRTKERTYAFQDVVGESKVVAVEDDYIGKDGWLNSYAWGKLFAKKLFVNLRFPDGQNWEDIATIYKALFQIEFISIVHEELYFYFTNINGIVAQKWTVKRLDEIESYEGILPFFKKYKAGVLYDRVLYSYWKACHALLQCLEKTEDRREKRKYSLFICTKMRKIFGEYIHCRNRNTKICIQMFGRIVLTLCGKLAKN